MSDAADAYIDELRGEKKQLQQLLNMFQAIIDVRQQIDQAEERALPTLPFNSGQPITIQDVGAHINTLSEYLRGLQMGKEHRNGGAEVPLPVAPPLGSEMGS